jgi:hypothetical protein
MRNPYYRGAHLTKEQLQVLVYHFCKNTSAGAVAQRVGRQRNTVNALYNKLRERLAKVTEAGSPFTRVTGEGRRKGSYMGVEFIRGKRAVAALEPVVIGVFQWPVISSLPCPPGVLTEILPDLDPGTLDSLRAGPYPLIHKFFYHDLLGPYFPYSVLGVDEFSDPFFHFFKRRMKRFYGIPPQTRYLHLKENEWRFNNQKKDLGAELIKILSAHPL